MERDLESVLDYAVKMANQIRFRPLNASVFGRHVWVQLIEALHYKSESCRFDSLLSLEFFIDIILQVAPWPWG
jgi:hypothetical protein